MIFFSGWRLCECFRSWSWNLAGRQYYEDVVMTSTRFGEIPHWCSCTNYRWRILLPIGSKVGRFSSTRTAQRIYCSVACIDEWFINKHNNIIVSSVIAIDLYFFIGRVVLQLQYHSILEDGTQSNFRNHLASPTLLLGVADRCRVRRGKCHIMIPLEFHVCHLAFLPGSIWGRACSREESSPE